MFRWRASVAQFSLVIGLTTASAWAAATPGWAQYNFNVTDPA